MAATYPGVLLLCLLTALRTRQSVVSELDLEGLRVERCDAFESSFVKEDWEEVPMERLNLSDCPSISGASIEVMALCMPLLSHLALSRCFSSEHEADLAAHAISGMPGLTFLDLSQTQIGDSAVTALLESLTLLRGLCIASCPLVTDEAFCSPSSSVLNELDLSGNRNLGPAALRRLDSAAHWGACELARSRPALHSLNITGSLVDLEALLDMQGGVGSLRSLKMGECECSPGGIVRLAHQAPHLEELDLSWCDHVDSFAVQVVFLLNIPMEYRDNLMEYCVGVCVCVCVCVRER